MSHNPPRIWFTDEHKRELVASLARRPKWHTVEELARLIEARAAQGWNVVLTPGTADYVARMLKRMTEGGSSDGKL